MLDDFTYDFLLQVCEGVQDKQVKAKERKIIIKTEKCNVERNYVSLFGILHMP